jgi:hypothetical protein
MKTFVKCVVAAVVLTLGATGLIAADNTYQEDWYKAKHGRISPSEEARQRAEANRSASRQETTKPDSGPAPNDWINDHYRAKYGRSAPYEEKERGTR